MCCCSANLNLQVEITKRRHKSINIEIIAINVMNKKRGGVITINSFRR
jgi:hypothetical protein